jgi:putative ABC transport system ATP-binding protein
LSLAKMPRGEIKKRVAEVLEEVGLGRRASHFPNELSGGEMQRVAIARAVIHRPPLILADEPTGNLDSKNGEMILDLVRGIHKSRRPTIVMATHSERAAAYGDYVVEVADGKVSREWGVGSRESEKKQVPPTPHSQLPTRRIE